MRSRRDASLRTGARVLPAVRGAVCEIAGTTSHCRGDRWWQRRPSGVNDCGLVELASVGAADLRRLSAIVAVPGVVGRLAVPMVVRV